MNLLEQQWNGILETLLAAGVVHEVISCNGCEDIIFEDRGTGEPYIWNYDRLDGTITLAKFGGY